jgi:DNA-directed RNA polymerase specialized sigma24 family protein
MNDGKQLLREYLRDGSEAAFTELVRRYVNLVYQAARRLVGGDAYLAQDVAQTVFIDLARKGPALRDEVALGGWLYERTFHVATKTLRANRRRRAREQTAMEMNTLQADTERDLNEAGGRGQS